MNNIEDFHRLLDCPELDGAAHHKAACRIQPECFINHFTICAIDDICDLFCHWVKDYVVLVHQVSVVQLSKVFRKDFFSNTFFQATDFFYMILYDEGMLLGVVKTSSEKLFLFLVHETELVIKLVGSCERFEI